MVSGLERVLGIYFWFEREGIVDRRDGWMDGRGKSSESAAVVKSLVQGKGV
jgi:hypothetical protein